MKRIAACIFMLAFALLLVRSGLQASTKAAPNLCTAVCGAEPTATVSYCSPNANWGTRPSMLCTFNNTVTTCGWYWCNGI